MVEAPRGRRCPVPRSGWRGEAPGAWLPGRVLKLPARLSLCTPSLHPPLGNMNPRQARLCRPQLLTATEDRNGITGPEVQRPCLFSLLLVSAVASMGTEPLGCCLALGDGGMWVLRCRWLWAIASIFSSPTGSLRMKEHTCLLIGFMETR